jgi:hypothetical protein
MNRGFVIELGFTFAPHLTHDDNKEEISDMQE